MKTCEINDGCTNPVEGRTNGCASCNRAMRKAERMINNFKVVKPVEKVSEKRAGELVEYAKLKREYMKAFPCCEVDDCHLKSVDIHHMGTRTNNNLLDDSLFLAVCRKHHIEITNNTKWAIEKGYSVIRTTNVKK